MKILVTTVGSSGDINPFIAIGAALAARGHGVTLLVNPFFESAVRQAGLAYLPLGEEMDFKVMGQVKDVTHARRGGMVVIKELVLPYVDAIIEGTERAIDTVGPDVVLLHHISMGSQWVCERRGIRYATAVLAPSMWLNPADRPLFGGVPEALPGWVLRAGLAMGKVQMRWMFDGKLNRFRRGMGLGPKRDHFFDDATGGSVNLGMWSPVMRGPMDGDPAQGKICGFTFHDRFERFEGEGLEMDGYLDECERAGEAPIMFTLGTAVVHAAGSFYHDAAEACRRLGRRGVLITNRPEYAPRASELPAGVRAFSYAPFSRVLHRGCCTVHHGGIGTTAQGLASGKPTVIVPHAYDQFDNAARARRLGVSVTLHRTKVDVDRLVAALRGAVDDPAKAARAAEVGAKVRREDGGAVAAAEIERMMGG